MALDTIPSQLVSPTPHGAETLGWRSTLLSDLALSDAMRTRIARGAGLQPADLHVQNTFLTTPAAATSLPSAALEVAIPPVPNVLTISANEQLATISLRAEAPSPDEAKRIVISARETFERAGSAATTPSLQRFTVEPVTDVRTRLVVGASPALMGAAIAATLSVLWCFFIGVLPGIRSLWTRFAGGESREPAATIAP